MRSVGLVYWLVMAAQFSCKRCWNILENGSHFECDGCAQKLHFICSGMTGDLYQQYKSSRKLWRACVLCKVCAKEKLSLKVKSCLPADSVGANLKAGQSIDSVSNSLNRILGQIRDMGIFNRNIANYVKILAMSKKNQE